MRKTNKNYKQMKKLIVMMSAVMAAAIVSCSSEIDCLIPSLEEVSVKLDYAFFEQGSMSRSGESVYESFYNDYVKTKILAPYSYELTFMVEDKVIASMKGPWGGAGIRLKEGDYKIVGSSIPKIYSSYQGAEDICDSLYLNFNEHVSITKVTEKITLTAKYDCYLLLFNADNIKSITASFGDKKLAQIGNVYYLFVRKDYYTTQGSYGPYNTELCLDIVKKDGTKIDNLEIGKQGFEKGKYYYFNDMTNSFDIDPMVDGN